MDEADTTMLHHFHSRTRRLRRSSLIIGVAALAAGAVGVGATDAASRVFPSRDAASPLPAHSRASTTPAIAPAATASPLVASAPTGTTVHVDLCATTGSVSVTNATGGIVSLPIWGYVPGDCTTGTGTAVLGGAPEIRVVAGDEVQVVLHNDLPTDSALQFQGQALPTDFHGAVPGGTATYTFTTTEPGTSLYGAGHTATYQTQIAMGLSGVLVVVPTAGQQANDDPATAFDHEATVVLGEIDPALNQSADPTGFDMRTFAPKYQVVNGKVHPAAGSLLSAAPGERVLLRYVNAGATYHSITVLGVAFQALVGDDGHARTAPLRAADHTVGPGQTADAIITVPNAAGDGTKLVVFDGSLQNRNAGRKPGAGQSASAAYGGAMTFIDVASTCSGPCADTHGPVSTIQSVDAGTGVVTATVSDAVAGNNTVTGAEYSIDAPGGPFLPMTAVDGSFDSATELVTVTVPSTTLDGLSSGTHTVYVRGADSVPNIGAVTAATFAVDKLGPASTMLSVTPSAANGTGAVTIRGTGDDSGRGDSKVVAAEYFIDVAGTTGSGIPMSTSAAAAAVALSAVIPQSTVDAFGAGSHSILVHSLDSAGNWGDLAIVTLLVDKAGPVTVSVSAPNAVNAATATLRVSAHVTDALTPVVRAEGFLDATGVTGKGVLLVPTDGKWDTTDEMATLDIPISTLARLSSGNHVVFVHGKDAAGNWGAYTSATFTVDRVAPTVSALGSPTTNMNRISIGATVSDNAGGSGVGRVEYFLDGNDPGRGVAKALTHGIGPAYTAVVDTRTLALGQHSIGVRARDALGNWSTVRSRTFTVTNRAFSFSTNGNSNPPGVVGTADDANVYLRNGNGYSRSLLASSIGIPAAADVDGLIYVNSSKIYLSFTDAVVLPNTPTLTAQDEDVVLYDATKPAGQRFSLYFDGSANGLSATDAGFDIDAFDISGSTLYFSTDGNVAIPGVIGVGDDADIYAYSSVTHTYRRVWRAQANGLAVGVDVDGLSSVSSTQFLFSFKGNNTQFTDIDPVGSGDVVLCDNGAWSLWFDGGANGLGSNNRNVDGLDVP